MNRGILSVLCFSLFFSVQLLAGEDARYQVQVNICMGERELLRKLGLSQEDAETQHTYLFETKKLALYEQGLIIRYRRSAKKNELAIKATRLSSEQREKMARDLGAECEVDVHGEEKSNACKLSVSLSGKDGEDLLRSGPTAYFSGPQSAMIRHMDGETALRDIVLLGPSLDKNWKWKSDPTSAKPQKLQLQVSLSPKGKEYTEVSVRAEPREWFQWQQSLIRSLRERGVSLCENQGSRRKERLSELLGEADGIW
jgi:hypothetical protein